jgi:hypothetical protein
MRREAHRHANSLQGPPIAVLNLFKGLDRCRGFSRGVAPERAPARHREPRSGVAIQQHEGRWPASRIEKL